MQSTGKALKQVMELLLNSLGQNWSKFAKIAKDFWLDVKEIVTKGNSKTSKSSSKL